MFAVGSMSEDQVALIYETIEALEYATTTTSKEYKEVTNIHHMLTVYLSEIGDQSLKYVQT